MTVSIFLKRVLVVTVSVPVLCIGSMWLPDTTVFTGWVPSYTVFQSVDPTYRQPWWSITYPCQSTSPAGEHPPAAGKYHLTQSRFTADRSWLSPSTVG